MAGLDLEGAGHTVVVTGIHFTPQRKPNANYLSFGEETVIHSVTVLDPSAPDYPEYQISGDKFLKASKFLLAFYDAKHIYEN